MIMINLNKITFSISKSMWIKNLFVFFSKLLSGLLQSPATSQKWWYTILQCHECNLYIFIFCFILHLQWDKSSTFNLSSQSNGKNKAAIYRFYVNTVVSKYSRSRISAIKLMDCTNKASAMGQYLFQWQFWLKQQNT